MKKHLLHYLLILFFLFLPEKTHAQLLSYQVEPNDTMWNIADGFNISFTELLEVNPQIINPNMIFPRQTLKIPHVDQLKRIEHKVIQLTNQERVRYGLAPLKPDWELSKTARIKAKDMRDVGYFAHTSPNFGSPFEMMKLFGVTFESAAENIAQGQTTPEVVVKSWMNSPGHRKNILNQKLTHIGVGYAKGGSGRHYWTQMFIIPNEEKNNQFRQKRQN